LAQAAELGVGLEQSTGARTKFLIEPKRKHFPDPPSLYD
jgi:hypothetical protein